MVNGRTGELVEVIVDQRSDERKLETGDQRPDDPRDRSEVELETGRDLKRDRPFGRERDSNPIVVNENPDFAERRVGQVDRRESRV